METRMHPFRISIAAAVAVIALTTSTHAQQSKFAGISGGATYGDLKGGR